jgi:hypothetical protein
VGQLPHEEDQIEERQEVTEVTSDLRVHPRHIRAAKICMGGSRRFFEKHNLSWADFVDNGISVSVLQRIGDPIALRAAHEAEVEAGNDGR